MKKSIILLCFTSLLASCIPVVLWRTISAENEYKDFVKTSKKSNDRLRVDGYYYYAEESRNPYTNELSKYLKPIFLYEDGTLKYMNLFIAESDDANFSEDSYETAHRSLINYIKSDVRIPSQSNWGHFKINNDSLFFKFFKQPPSGLGIRLHRGYGIIESDTSFVIKYCDYLEDNEEKLYRFRKSDIKPDSSRFIYNPNH